MIPVIDLAAVRSGADPTETARRLGAACRGSGFFQVTGHGVSLGAISDVYDRVTELLDRSEADKRALQHEYHPFRGWMQVTSTDSVEYFERFEACMIDSPDDARRKGVQPEQCEYFAANVWPEEPEFRRTFLQLGAELSSLGAALLGVLATDLGLPRDHFEPLFEPEPSCLSASRYEKVEGVGADGVLFKEHTDLQVITLLHQRGTYDGLQVISRSGELETVERRDDAIVVNLGQMMERWTNGVYVATPHRVIPPPTSDGSRMSLAYFYSPAIDTEIGPIPQLVGDGAPRYDTITPYAAGTAFIASKLQQREAAAADAAP